MKKIFYLIASIALLASCKEELPDPVADFKYTIVRNGIVKEFPDTVFTGEVVTFTNLGSGDNFVIYTGSPESDYSRRSFASESGAAENLVGQNATGYALLEANTKYSKEYSYSTQSGAGGYNLVYIATTVGDFGSETKSVTLDDYYIHVLDTVATLKEFGFKKPTVLKNAIISQTNLGGDTVRIKAMLKYGASVKDFDKAIFQFQNTNSIVTRNDAPVYLKGLQYRDTIDLSGGKTVVYKSIAPNGFVKHYEVSVGFYDRAIEKGNDLLSATILGNSYTPDTTSLVVISPVGSNTTPVSFSISSYATLFVGKKALSTVTIADLKAVDSIFIVSEALVTKGYAIKVIEDSKITSSTLQSDFGFQGATGFPLVIDDNAKTIDATLASTFNLAKLIPVFPQSKYSSVSIIGAEEVKLNNGVDTVDFTNPVDFRLINGIDTLEYTITVK